MTDPLAQAEAFVRENFTEDTAFVDAGLDEFALPDEERVRLIGLAAELRAESSRNGSGPSTASWNRALDGAAFILDASVDTETETVWGDPDGRALWAAGEPLMIVAPQGVGKTTTGQRLALGRIGLCPNLLGFPIARDDRRVLYVAADRPRQARRSFRRMVSDDDRQALLERLVIWPGPLPFTISDPSSPPDRIVGFCEHFGAGTLILDSLKDIAVALSSEETGGRVALAMQALVAAGIEVLVLHHQRKAKPDAEAPKHLDDVYGSTWLTSACGSVLLLWGKPGDVFVELHHLKQPAEDIGPLAVQHDHVRGLPTVPEPVDLEALLRAAGAEGLMVVDAARATLGKATPSRNDVEKMRRRLNALAERGAAVHIPSLIPGDAGRYVFNGPGKAEA